MRYLILNKLYMESATLPMLDHYHQALKNRGWVPDLTEYRLVKWSQFARWYKYNVQAWEVVS